MIETVDDIIKQIQDIDERLKLVECRWEPKLIVYGVFRKEQSFLSEIEILLGVYSSQQLAQAKIDRSITEQISADRFVLRELTLDAG